MIIFTILLTILAVLAAVALTFIGIMGGAALAIFGDLIVFGFIVWLIIKFIKAIRKRKKE